MKKPHLQPWSRAIAAAENAGDLAPLLAELREAGHGELADALSRWGTKPKPEISDYDLELETAAEWFREMCPRGHPAKLARESVGGAEAVREGVIKWIAVQYRPGAQPVVEGERVLSDEQEAFARKLGRHLKGQVPKVAKRKKKRRAE